jgi:hypothetical protein
MNFINNTRHIQKKIVIIDFVIIFMKLNIVYCNSIDVPEFLNSEVRYIDCNDIQKYYG